MEDVLLMSVIVKGMKMPTGCGSCDFAGFLPYEDPYCRRLMRTIRVVSKRLDDCPLEAIPPHGRLIDADKLCLSSGFSTATEYGRGRSDQIEAIKSNAPTVIQAEEDRP